jgi:DNA transformation protein and related proteins
MIDDDISPGASGTGTADDPVTVIRNLGPAMARALADAGIGTATALRALGPDAAYGRMLAAGHRPHFIGYYVLVMGLQGRPWNDCKGPEKAALRLRFDAIVAGTRTIGGPAIERILDEIGTGLRR